MHITNSIFLSFKVQEFLLFPIGAKAKRWTIHTCLTQSCRTGMSKHNALGISFKLLELLR